MAFSKKEKTYNGKQMLEMVNGCFEIVNNDFTKATETNGKDVMLDMFFTLIKMSILAELTKKLETEEK